MAKVLDLPAVPPFSVSDHRSLSQRWEKWTKSLDYYIRASGVTDAKQKRAVLLHLAGHDVQEIFETLPNTGDDYKTALEKLNEYFQPKRNIPYERHVFRQISQQSGESMDAFVTRLRTASKTCNFGDQTDDAIRDQAIDKCNSIELRRRLLRENEIDLAKLLTISRAFEQSYFQAQEMEQFSTQPDSINAVRPKQYSTGVFRREMASLSSDERNSIPNNQSPGQSPPKWRSQPCYCCGSTGHRAKDSRCPANGKTCRSCGKIGHFASVCRSTSKHQNPTGHQQSQAYQVSTKVNATYSSDDECIFGVQQFPNLPTINITVDGVSIPVVIDSGATVNIIDLDTYYTLRALKKVKIMPSNLRLFTYGSTTPLNIRGTISVNAECDGKQIPAQFVVVDNQGSGCLLGHKSASQLDLLHVANSVNSEHSPRSPGHIQTKFPKVFEGVGKLKNFQQTIHVDPQVQPVAQPPRRLPFHVRRQVEAKLDELQRLDIIEQVSGPTPWVSPLVVVPKPNGEVRICVDMRRVNTAVIRERYPIPTMEDILQDLTGATVFSKLDLRWGYHQIELNEQSRQYTTFATHTGLYRYKRLMFGVSAAPEIYQHVIQQALQGCPGVRNISDDIIVFGKTQQEHDCNLTNVLARLQECGLTLNGDKCKFNVPEITFFGYTISADGIRPTDETITAIKNARKPSNTSEVRSFLGLVNYCSRFIPNFSTTAAPLRQLTHKGAPFIWTNLQQHAFESLQKTLTSSSVMAHFDPKAPTQLRVDASPVGLGAILTQTHGVETRPVAYASRTLTPVEMRYSQTEREALAVVWGCERFHLYLYGTMFDIYTDHKPLEIIYSPTSKPPARIERWGLRLQPYTFRVKYSPGINNPADVLSRLPLPNQAVNARNPAEEYVHYIARNAAPKAISLSMIQEATNQDPDFQVLRACITDNHWPKDNLTRAYYGIRHELTVVNDVILRGSRILMPQSLRETTLKLAHEGHQGVVKTKQLLREKVWWPGIDQAVERLIRTCLACQSQGPHSTPQPLRMTTMPSRPWQTLHADICGPFPTGESLFVMVDTCSRWPEVHVLTSTTSTAIIKCMKTTFATHGLPQEIVTDNGPQFTSAEFSSYLSTCGIIHRKVAPYWPQANSEVERFNRTIEKAIRAANVEGKNWKEELDIFLLNYRSTSHCTTGQPPAVLLFGRNIRNKLPTPPSATSPDVIPETVREHDRKRKEKIKSYADEHNRASSSNIKKGDTVLLRQPRQTKLSTTYDPKPYIVEEKKGSSVLLKRLDERQIMRNEFMVCKIPKETEVTKDGNEKTRTSERDSIEKREKKDEISTRQKRTRKSPD